MPESQAYMDLLAFERKLDATIARKRLEIQEMLRRPLKEKRKLRLFVSHHFFTSEPESGVRPMHFISYQNNAEHCVNNITCLYGLRMLLMMYGHQCCLYI